MKIIKYRKIFYALSGLLILASIVFLFVWGLNQGIDFKGGSLLEISYANNSNNLNNYINANQIKDILGNSGYGDASVRTSGVDGYIIRLREITPEEKDSIVASLFQNNLVVEVKDFNVIGPILGREAVLKSGLAILFVIIAILFFIALVFRKVSKPISSWVYGSVAIVALIHDVIIPVGAFSILGHFYGFEVDTLFVTAILVVLGFSVHDTIVVFDRVRENLQKDINSKKGFDEIVGTSIGETFTRSINTSFTTLLAISALYIWGPESTHHFALALGIGIFTGTYSSIFIGSPLLVTINRWKNRK